MPDGVGYDCGRPREATVQPVIFDSYILIGEPCLAQAFSKFGDECDGGVSSSGVDEVTTGMFPLPRPHRKRADSLCS